MNFPHTSEILNFLQTSTHEFQQLACSLPPPPPLRSSHNLFLFTSHIGLLEISYKEKACEMALQVMALATEVGSILGIKIKEVNQFHTAVL